MPVKGGITPEGLVVSFMEIFEMMNLWEYSDFFSNTRAAFDLIDVVDNCLVLKRNAENKKFLMSINRILDGKPYELQFY